VGELDRVREEENDIVFELVVDGLHDEEIVFDIDNVFEEVWLWVVDADKDEVDVWLMLIVQLIEGDFVQLFENERDIELVLLSVDVKELDDDIDDDDVQEVVKETEEEREGVTEEDDEPVRDGDSVADALFVEERVCV
jgi:hypothetical protein